MILPKISLYVYTKNVLELPQISSHLINKGKELDDA